ncbi:hypothetical protein BJ166DRAFT_521613 [Pestalotiopsis sp. NC0098]|nr:hypothetical protein BJ166DRAFT_521613 [Pestalotiopsis sp. NC0098]
MEIPTYHRAPNFSIPPDGHVQLGTIVLDLKQLESINGRDIPPISSDGLYKNESKGFQTTISSDHGLDLGFWAKIFTPASFGAEVSGGRQNNVETNVYVRQLETSYFFPSIEYISTALQRPSLKTYLQITRKKHPVYMITGLKIARGATWQSSTTKGYNVALGWSLPNPSAGVVEFGPKINNFVANSSSTQVEDAGDFVLAYRVTKIWYSGLGRMKTEQYLNGAIMAGDDEADPEGLEEVDLIRDVAADGLSAEIIEISTEGEAEESGVERSVWILHEAL